MGHIVESHQFKGHDSQLRDQVVPGVARILPYEVREGGDGDTVCMDADVLFQFLDEQSRSLRDFIRFAREG